MRMIDTETKSRSENDANAAKMNKSTKHSFKSPFTAATHESDSQSQSNVKASSKLGNQCNNEISKTTKPKASKVKSALPVRSLTNEQYDSLFDGVLERMNVEYPLEDDPISGIKEYATLQDVPSDTDLDAAINFALEACAEPLSKKVKSSDQSLPKEATTKPVTPQKSNTPIWRSVSPVSRIKEDNRRKTEKKKAASMREPPGYSLGNFRAKDNKAENKIRKPKCFTDGESKVSVNKKAKTSKTSKRDKTRSVAPGDDYDRDQHLPWSLTQECTKGLWIQCANVECCKWRFLSYVHDPSTYMSVKWVCSMYEGGDEHITCDSPMQCWDESADWTYNTYTEGSVVWARVVGYPWWPAIVEVDPDMEAFVFCYEYRRYTPVEYHVTFFDTEKATRSWLPPKDIKPFTGDFISDEMKPKPGNKRLLESIKMARDSLSLPLVQRLRTYGFPVRYEGNIVGPKKSTSSAAHTKPPASTKVRKSRADMKTNCETHKEKLESRDKVSKRKVKPKKAKEPESAEERCVSPRKPASADKSKTEANNTLQSEGNMTSSQIDMEKELDEIEQILSQSSQSLMLSRSQSLSPAPKLNAPVTPFRSPKSQPSQSQLSQSQLSQSHPSQSQLSQSQPDQSQLSPSKLSQSQPSTNDAPVISSQPTLESKSRSVSPVSSQKSKPTKKGFKCPLQTGSAATKSVNSSVFTQELSGKSCVPSSSVTSPERTQSNPASVSAKQSVFKSAAALTNQSAARGKSSVFTSASSLARGGAEENGEANKENNGTHEKMNLDKSMFTQELFGDKVTSQPLKPLADNSVFTQELSGKKPSLALNSSVFTQELSNKDTKGKSKRAKKTGSDVVDDYGSYSENSSDSCCDADETIMETGASASKPDQSNQLSQHTENEA